jgi:hypothetical protein
VDDPFSHCLIDYRDGSGKGGLGQSLIFSFYSDPNLLDGGSEIRSCSPISKIPGFVLSQPFNGGLGNRHSFLLNSCFLVGI